MSSTVHTMKSTVHTISLEAGTRPGAWLDEYGWETRKGVEAIPVKPKSDSVASLKPLVHLARLFGVLPIAFSHGTMRFRWGSLLTVYSLVVASVLTGYFVFKIVAYSINSKTNKITTTATFFELHKETSPVVDLRTTEVEVMDMNPFQEHFRLDATSGSDEDRFDKSRGAKKHLALHHHSKRVAGQLPDSEGAHQRPVLMEQLTATEEKEASTGRNSNLRDGSRYVSKLTRQNFYDSNNSTNSSANDTRLGEVAFFEGQDRDKKEYTMNSLAITSGKSSYELSLEVNQNVSTERRPSFRPEDLRSVLDEEAGGRPSEGPSSVPTHRMSLHKERDLVELVQTSIFYCLGASGAVLLLRAAPGFVRLCDRWTSVEEMLGREVVGSSRRSVLLLLGTVMVSALGETTSSMFYNVRGIPTFWPFMEEYIRMGHQDTVRLVGYSKALGILLLLVNKYATFVWNFVDLFISCVALVLTRHLRGYNSRLERETGDGASPQGRLFWRVAREQHLALQCLVEAADGVVGPLLLQSYVCNLFFTLVQLYNGLRPFAPSSGIGRIYLTWSFLHLLARLAMVSLACANLHGQTVRPLNLLLAVPSDSMCPEVTRFLQQLQARTVGLSGCGFFLVNKSFILATTGALITYEVILLQLNLSNSA